MQMEHESNQSPQPARSQHERSPGGQIQSYRMNDEVRSLEQDASNRTGGRTAKTLAKEGTLRVTLIHANAGTHIEPSATAGEASLQVIEGRIRVQDNGHSMEVGPGELLILPHNLQQPLEAVDDSAFLLTVAWEEGAGAWDQEAAQGKL